MITICMHALAYYIYCEHQLSLSHLISWWVQGKQLWVSVALPRFLVEAIKLLRAAEGQQPLHTLVWCQTPQVKVRGGQRAARVITQPR